LTDQNLDSIDTLEQPSIEGVLHELATSDKRPAAAIAACLSRFDEAAPALLALLQRAATGGNLTEDDATLLFRGLHILGGHREPRAFEPLLRLLRRPYEEVDFLLADAITASLSKIAAGVFDGDADALFEAISHKESDEFVRRSLFGTATFLTFDGKIERELMERFLERFHEERRAPKGDFTWYGFVQAVALLGFTSLVPLAEQAIREKWVEENIFTLRELTEDLRAAERAPGDVRRFEKQHLGYMDDVYDALAWADPVEYSKYKGKRCCLAA
jgi:uncharacterized protein